MRTPLFLSCWLFLLVLATILLGTSTVSAHEDEEGATGWLIARHSEGPLSASVDETARQWQNAFETEVESTEGRAIEVLAVNNGTHLYFLLIWKDETGSTASQQELGDGAAIIFEKVSEEGRDDIWFWGTKPVPGLSNVGIDTHAKWEDGKWFVAIGRSLVPDDGGIRLRVGKATDDLIKIGVFDGGKGEALSTMEAAETAHLTLLILPPIDTTPRDVYFWSGLLAIGSVYFLSIELKAHRRSS